MHIVRSTIFTSVLISAVAVVSLSATTVSAQPKSTRTAKSISKPISSVETARMQEPAAQSEIRRGLRFEAFADAQARITNKDEIDDRGFTLNDAALYISKDFGSGLIAMIDLPFSSAGAVSNSFTFGTVQSQAYFQLTRGSLQTKFGQFDTPYGIELNDSRDRFFADAGVVKQFAIPKTHTGVMVGWGQDNLLLRGLLANPTNAGAMTNQNPEFGIQGRFDGAKAYGSLGFLMNEAKTGTDNKTNMLIEVMGGAKVDKIAIDASFDSKKTAGIDKTAMMIALQAVFTANSELDLGGRLEWMKDAVLPGPILAESVIAFTAGPSYRFDDDVTLRGDLSFGTIKPAGTGATETNLFAIGFSTVASF